MKRFDRVFMEAMISRSMDPSVYKPGFTVLDYVCMYESLLTGKVTDKPESVMRHVFLQRGLSPDDYREDLTIEEYAGLLQEKAKKEADEEYLNVMLG